MSESIKALRDFLTISPSVVFPDEVLGFLAPIEAENAKLQETLQRRTKQFESMVEMWAERGAENAKLRELIQDAWGSGHPDRSCEACDIMDECHAEMERYGRCLFERRIEQRMNELGIEVDK